MPRRERENERGGTRGGIERAKRARGEGQGLTLIQGTKHLLQHVIDVDVQLLGVLVHVLQVCLYTTHLGPQGFTLRPQGFDLGPQGLAVSL